MEKIGMQIGYSFDTRMGSFNAVVKSFNGIEGLEGIEITPKELGGLAGPNNVIQFITEHWETILLASGSVFFSQLLKNGADALWKNKDRFIEGIKGKITPVFFGPYLQGVSARHFGTTVVAALPRAPSESRNAGIELVSNDPYEIAWQLGHLALNAERIQAAFDLMESHPDARVTFEQNPDCSIKLTITDDGELKIVYKAHDPSSNTYVSQAKLFLPDDHD